MSQNNDPNNQNKLFLENAFNWLSEKREKTSEVSSKTLKKPTARDLEIINVYLSGKHYEEHGDFEKALDVYSKLIDHDPAVYPVPNAILRTGYIHLKRNNLIEAIKIFRYGANRLPRSIEKAQAMFLLANCLEKQGKYDDATEIYAEIVRVYPTRTVLKHVKTGWGYPWDTLTSRNRLNLHNQAWQRLKARKSKKRP